MKRLVLIGILLMLLATVFVFGQSSPESVTSVSEAKQGELIQLAKKRLIQRKAAGIKMDQGPCLGVIATGWVADVSHNPRLPIDDKPENQCDAYNSGSAEHFIELDTEGNLIRIK